MIIVIITVIVVVPVIIIVVIIIAVIVIVIITIILIVIVIVIRIAVTEPQLCFLPTSILSVFTPSLGCRCCCYHSSHRRKLRPSRLI